jgi:peptidoglycan/xylan/chitin deacetylase (PgdA/CDA1 family)
MADIRKLIQTGPNRDTMRTAFPILNMVIDSAIESATTANEAKTQSTDAVNTANDAKEQSEYIQTQLDTVTGASTIDPAVEQMKVGSDGYTVYNSPDERIREEHNSVTAQLADIDKPIVVFTFDDVLVGDSVAYEVLKEYGYVGNFGLNSDRLYLSDRNPLNLYREYTDNGFEILSHSASHIEMDIQLSEDAKAHEIKESADKLRRLGFRSNGFIVPYSAIEANNLEYAKNIYDYILIGGSGLNGKSDFTNKTLTRASQFVEGVEGSKTLIDQAIADRKLLILYDHSIGASGSLTETEFREILAYLKTKSDAGQVEVHNMQNAVTKFYGRNIENRSNMPNTKNFAPTINSTEKWVLEENAGTAVFIGDSTYGEGGMKVAIPDNTSVGSQIVLSYSELLRPTFKNMGERLIFSIDLAGSNSQASYFDSYIDVVFLDDSDSPLLTKSKMIHPSASTLNTFRFEVLNEYPVDPSSVKKVKISLRFVLNTTLTTTQNFRMLGTKLNFAEAPAVEKPSFHAQQTSAQSIPTGSFTKLTFNTVSLTGDTSFTGSTFTIKKNGTYCLAATVGFSSSVDAKRLVVAVYRNGSAYANTNGSTSGTGHQGISVSCVAKGKAGDVFEVFVYQDTGASQNSLIKPYTHFSGFLID